MDCARPLILVGGGGHCRSVIDAAESAGMPIRGIIDRPEAVGTDLLGYPVVGTDADIASFAPDCDFVVTVGSVGDFAARERLIALIGAGGGRLATIVASTARLSPHVRLGEGTVVLHHALVNAGACVGANCIINSGAIVEHDATIGDDTHIATGAIVNGGCRIGSTTLIGSGATVLQGRRVTDRVVLGAASLVTRDIDSPGLWLGSPARRRNPFISDNTCPCTPPTAH